ncbi:MAG: RNA polymerase sigma factor [Chloroflexota bacterium]|nr:RNA polymerase sigma factor [Chloroflexota bacterium]
MRQPTPARVDETRTDPDLEAVRAAQADRAAFATLYRRYLDRVYGYAFYQLGDHHDAEDVTERIFLAALAALGGFRDTGSTFRAWLFRIAHNTIANAHRTRARRPTVALPDDWDRPAPDADPARLVGRGEELREVLALIDELPEERRQVILLRFADELTSREIGIVLDRSEGAVRVLLHRALRELAARLPENRLA